ncbi:UNVERIFIED_CONTAM: hypothetical protein BEN50_12800 [Euhalothece sp. KZN 001]
MTDDLPGRVTDLERKMAASEARAQERLKREKRIEEKVDMLVDDMNRRHGREAAERRDAEHNRDDRHETGAWLRAFVPTGFWVALWAAVLWVAEQLGIRPGGN